MEIKTLHSKSHSLVNKTVHLLNSWRFKAQLGTTNPPLADFLETVYRCWFRMSELTTVFPQIGWAVPQCHWPISHLWPPMMNFKQEEDFLRCKQATDTTSSMQCSPSVPFRLTYFSTRNSSTQVSASNPVLPFHFSCNDAQDKRRKRGENGAGTRCMKFTQGLP